MKDSRAVPRKKKEAPIKKAGTDAPPISQKQLAKHLNLSPTTVSLVLNRAPEADAIPEETKQRIFEAARTLNYRPNFLARSLRSQRSYTVGVLVPELSDGYSSAVLSGVEESLIKEGYFYIVASHRHNPERIKQYPKKLFERCVEGFIAVDTQCPDDLPLPTVAIPGHENLAGVTNIVLNHVRAAELALQHLTELGHREIAFIRGQAFSSDSAVRWDAITEVAGRMQLPIDPALVVQLQDDSPLPEVGFAATKSLLASGRSFTALFSWNDISAIGAIEALREAGYRVPEDISVVGFDDVAAARFHSPPLTTVRQPLLDMGRIAAKTLLCRIANIECPTEVEVEPELIVRRSTARRIATSSL